MTFEKRCDACGIWIHFKRLSDATTVALDRSEAVHTCTLYEALRHSDNDKAIVQSVRQIIDQLNPSLKNVEIDVIVRQKVIRN